MHTGYIFVGRTGKSALLLSYLSLFIWGRLCTIGD